MALSHVTISAKDPERLACIQAALLGGQVMLLHLSPDT
jgi:hypothetical protein